MLTGLATTELTYAVTGSLAAAQWAAYADPRLASLYVDDVAAAAVLLGLRAVDSGANILLAAPASAVVFDRSSDIETGWSSTPSGSASSRLAKP